MAILPPKKLYAGTPVPSTASTLYAVPNGKKATVKHILISNPTNQDATITINFAGLQMINKLNVEANNTKSIEGWELNLESNDTISAFQDTYNALKLYISGMEWG